MNLQETPVWEPGIYQIEETDPVVGGPDGISNRQAKQLASRTLWLQANKQPLDTTLTALAALITAADKLIYATGADTFATSTLTAFARTLLDDADAATARVTLGAAPLASPALTGTPTAPTAAVGTNTTQLANTAFVQAAIAALVNSSPAALDTLNELATALGNDPNFATTMTNALAGKQPLDATLTALAALTTAADKLIYATGADTFATSTLTAFARTLLDDADAATARATLGAAPLVSPALTGTPTAPTAAVGTNTTQLANTAFVQAAIAALVNSSPAALDTLNELATALGNDPNFATTMTNALAGKQPIDATLTALATVITAADQLIYATGQDTFGVTTLTAFARTLLAGADASAICQLLGVMGTGQSYTNMTASRAFDTLYTNTSGRWRFVMATPVAAASKTYSIEVDGEVRGGLSYGSATVKSPMFFGVPPGKTYRITTTGTPALENWQEA